MYGIPPLASTENESLYQALAIQDPGRAWYLARIQALRDLRADVQQMGEQGDERGKTAGELAQLLSRHMQSLIDSEWEGYIQHAAGKSPNVAFALRGAGMPVSSQMVDFPAEGLKLPTATWATLTPETGARWSCPGDGTDETFVIDELFSAKARPDADAGNLVVPMVDRRHVATAALHELLIQFIRNGLHIIKPCSAIGGWRRLKFLSQHYRQSYQVSLAELPADELSGWDKDEVSGYALSDAANKINQLATTGMAIRVLALGAVTQALAEWTRQIDAARPDANDIPLTDQLINLAGQWGATFEQALASMNNAVLMDQGVNPSHWDVEVIQRPLPGTIPVLHASRRS